jgi:acylphosphatase
MLQTKRVHLFITGRVQGVFYRSSTKEIAQKLCLKGWVRNLSDGRVEVLAQGDESNLKDCISWAWQGPAGAFVTDVSITWEDTALEFSDFRITN